MFQIKPVSLEEARKVLVNGDEVDRINQPLSQDLLAELEEDPKSIEELLVILEDSHLQLLQVVLDEGEIIERPREIGIFYLSSQARGLSIRSTSTEGALQLIGPDLIFYPDRTNRERYSFTHPFRARIIYFLSEEIPEA